jgi:hypothetical protein
MEPTETELLYRPSWLDRFTDWIGTLPVPRWLVYLTIYLLLAAQGQLSEWAFGRTAWGELNTDQFLYHLFVAEVLFFYNYLNIDAKRALDEFRPLLKHSPEELDRIEFSLTTQPAGKVRIFTALGLIIGTYYAYSLEVMTREVAPLSFELLYSALGFILPMALALIFCYRIVRQLRIVSRLYESAPEIDLFNLNPVYALSNHTAKTGIIFLFLIYSNLLLSPGAIQIPTAMITTAIISILSLSAFILPLQGINRRLAREKKALLMEIHKRIRRAFNELNHDFDTNQFSRMSEREKSIASLERQKAYVEKIPTWPWQPTTMRGFVSALLLPIAIWITQQILERLLQF